MKNKYFKVFTLISLLTLLIISIWFFFKPYDYTISFKSNALNGTINQSLKLWAKSLNHSKIIENNSINNIKQSFDYEEATYIYNWTFENKNDSSTQVTVDIKNPETNIAKRFSSLLKETKLEMRAKDNVSNFIDVLNSHLESFDVKVIGEALSPEIFCAYMPFETKQMLKANEMMKNYTFLSNQLLKNKIELNGYPMVEVTKWDTKKDNIYFNFCFPIVKTDSLPKFKKIKYKKIKSKKSLKAIYHGNYISSDRAWYRLLNYADKKGIKLIHKPLEVFFNNPSLGANDRNWKTEIYIPIKE